LVWRQLGTNPIEVEAFGHSFGNGVAVARSEQDPIDAMAADAGKELGRFCTQRVG
jgi:hypothetical protein